MEILTLGLAASVALSPQQPPSIEAVKALVSDPQGDAAPGCVVGAFRAGRPLFFTASGAADIENRQPLDPDTLFYAASVSKQFTALAAVKLAEQGKLDLDQDIRKYLPELPVYEAPVTARMLMHHTAGIRDWHELVRLTGVPPFGRAVDRSTVLKMLLRQRKTNFKPGTAHSYSGGGYLLLAEIIERVSGMSFPDYAKRTILTPLGMNRSYFLSGTAPAGKNVARGYLPVGGKFEVRDTYPTFGGSGGLMISLADLGKFERDIEVGHKVWTPFAAKTMTTPGRLSSGAPIVDPASGLGYAAGLRVGKRAGESFVQHGGGAEAFRNMYARLPERRLAVAMFCNRGDWSPLIKSDAVIELIEGDILADAPPAPPKPSVAGRYHSDELMATYEVSIAGDGLHVALSSELGRTPSSMTFRDGGDGVFVGSENTRLIFDEDRGGLTIKSRQVSEIHFRRVD